MFWIKSKGPAASASAMSGAGERNSCIRGISFTLAGMEPSESPIFLHVHDNDADQITIDFRPHQCIQA